MIPSLRIFGINLRAAISIIPAALLLQTSQSSGKASGPAEAFGLFQSRDLGRTWKPRDSGLPRNSRIHALASHGNLLLAATDQGLYFSEENGMQWQPVHQVPRPEVPVLRLVTLGGRTFAAVGPEGLWESEDGRNWKTVTAFPAKRIRSLATWKDSVVAGTDSGEVFLGGSNGEKWHPAGPGLPAGAQVFALAVHKDELWAALYSQGLYRWTPASTNWSRQDRVEPLALAVTESRIIAGHNPGGIHQRLLSGGIWTGSSSHVPDWFAAAPGFGPAPLPPHAPVWELAADERIALAGAGTGIYSSTDHGQTWTRAVHGLPAQSPGIAFLIQPRLLLAATLLSP